MKMKFIVLALPLALLIVLGGCATTGNDKAADTSSALTKSAAKIGQGSALIDQTVAALNDLVTNPQPDLKKQFKTFSSAVDDLGSAAKDVAAKTEAMKVKGAAYFEHWDTELATINNENIRERSQDRKKDVAKRFEKIGQRYEEAKTEFEPFMSDLRDIQKALATDLTPAGIDSIKKAAAKAAKGAASGKKVLGKLAEDFQQMGLSLAPVTPEKRK